MKRRAIAAALALAGNVYANDPTVKTNLSGFEEVPLR